MPKKTLLTLLVVAVSALALAACGGSGSGTSAGAQSGEEAAAKPTSGGTLRLAQDADIVGFDQTTIVHNASIRVISQITEPLYRADADGKLVPWLATDYEKSKDSKTWTFTLRKGVEFSDGKPVTAEDVVFTLDRSRKSAAWGFLLENVKAVSAPSPMTVRVDLKQPSGALLAQVANFANGIVPQGLGGKTPSEWAQSPIGTGPFMLEKWTRGQTVSLTRNPGYWRQGEPLLDRVEINAIPNSNSRLSQLQAGQQDVSFAPPFAQLSTLEASGIDVVRSAPARVAQLYLNLDSEPFTDPKVREAVDLAIDREAIVKGSLFGAGETARGFLASSVQDPGDLPELEQDLAKAEQIVAGLPAGSRSFTIIVTSGDALATSEGQILQQQLETAGFDVTLEPVDPAALNDSWQTSSYTALLTGTSSDIVDPSEIVGFFVGNNGIFTNAPTDEVAALLAKAESTADPAARGDIYNQIQQLVNEQHSILSLVQEPYVYGAQPSVSGFEVNPTGIYWLAEVGLEG